MFMLNITSRFRHVLANWLDFYHIKIAFTLFRFFGDVHLPEIYFNIPFIFGSYCRCFVSTCMQFDYQERKKVKILKLSKIKLQQRTPGKVGAAITQTQSYLATWSLLKIII